MGSKPTKTEKTIRIVESDSSFGKQILKKYSDIIPPTIQQVNICDLFFIFLIYF